MSNDERFTCRPTLPLVLWASVGLWAGVYTGEMLVWQRGAGLADVAGYTAAAALAVVLAVRVSAAGVMACAASLLVGLMVSGLYWTDLHSDSSAFHNARPTKLTGEVVSDIRVSAFGQSSDVVVESPKRVLLTVSWPAGTSPEPGRAVFAYGTAKALSRDQFGRRLHRRGAVGTYRARLVRTGQWAQSVRGRAGPLRNRALRAIDRVKGPGGDVLAGVVTGDRGRLAGTSAEMDFRTTGLSHLVAISGSHLVVVAALVSWLALACGLRLRARLCLVLCLMLTYVVFSGVQASAIRAWLMAFVGAASTLSGRRTDPLAGLSVAVFAALVVWPPVAFDIGFQLSVAAVFGLIAFSRLASQWLAKALPIQGRWLADPLALTLTAQAATLPLTINLFGVVSTVAPLTNLLAGPVITASMVLGLMGVLTDYVSPGLSTAMLAAGGRVAGVAVGIASTFARLPSSAVSLNDSGLTLAILTALAFISVWALWPRPTATKARLVAVALLIFSCLAFAPASPRGGAHIVVLDVGQGDAILVRDGGQTALIDTGPDATTLRRALARHGVRSIDTLVLTHTHADHVGGIAALASGIKVSSVLVAEGARDELADEAALVRSPITELRNGSRWTIGRFTFNVLSPADRVADAAANESCVVVLATLGDFGALLTGDAEANVLEQIDARGDLGHVTALKVGHHGSADAVSETVLSKMKPDVGLISVGADNRFGHPTRETLQLLADDGAEALRTDVLGDLIILVDAHKWKVVADR